ncbi:MAG: Na(+)/H(+) antiporter subunit D [Acidobacteriota bacterium]|jgi:multicomponent Na+:H+ antiporter subunit D|nr:Na(+)/H(+) antiporter subunit D [Acidobacteriota bacterium]
MLNEWIIPPALIMIIGALLLPVIPRRLRSSLFVLTCVLALARVWTFSDGATLTVPLMDYTLTLVKVDALSRVFGTIFALIAAGGGIYAFHIRDAGQQTAALLYAAGALGVTFAGDLFTLFLFWELMAFTSVFLVWARRVPESRKAGFRYLIYHVLGGGLLFAGILMYLGGGGDMAVSRLSPGQGPAVWIMLLGVAINAAIPPLHTWLSDAYPRATVTGAVFMSAFTTKSAVYVLIRVFPGWEILLWAGVIMTLYGVVFAVLSNDIRGILAYHIISQVGYMVAGVGIGTEMALNGSAAHAFSHILYKALLFMGAGAVIHATGKHRLSDLGGLARYMPRTLILYMVAAFSISGVPLFNGFISKSMVVSAAGAAHYPTAMLLLNLAAVGTFLSVGIKLPWFTWFSREKPAEIEVRKPPINMFLGMGLAAILCFLYGVMPGLLYRMLPFPVDFEPYTTAHLVESVQMLLFTFIGFWLLRRRLTPHEGISLDLDWFYRRSKPFFRNVFVNAPAHLFDQSDRTLQGIIAKAVAFGRNPMLHFSPPTRDKTYTPDRYRPPAGSLVLVTLAALCLIVILSLV